MLKQDIRILIIDDDESIGKSIEATLNRSGFNSRWVSSGEEAISLSKISEFHAVVVDCMLPRMNGIDLTSKLKKIIGDHLKIFLMSAIFKDKAFINNSIRESQAIAYFVKPFDSSLLIESIENIFEGELEVEKEPLFQLHNLPTSTPAERIQAIELTETMHGFDLPFVYSLICSSKMSGILNILTAEGEISSVVFSNGRICQVRVKDKTSYFGILLVEHGFTSNEDVNLGLNFDSPKPLGEKLVDASALSPHAIQIIQKEQMAIRLSKSIQDTSIQVSFLEQGVADERTFLDTKKMQELYNDWVSSKLTFSWLKTYYTPWLDYQILKGPEYSNLNNYINTSLLKPFQNFDKIVQRKISLNDLLEENQKSEQRLLRVIHLLLIERIILFSPRPSSSTNYDGKFRRLKSMHDEMQNKDFFEVLGVSKNAREKEINRAYLELAKVLHPDKIEPNVPNELRSIQEKVFSKITQAYDILRDKTKRDHYKSELEMGHANDIMKQESIFEEALALLHRGRYQKAFDLLENLIKENPNNSDFLIGFLWSKIKVGTTDKNKDKFIEEITYELSQIPPESRHSSNFLFIKGLHLKLMGQPDKALSYFRHSQTLDPSHIAAKREILILKPEEKKAPFTGEITSVVGALFSNKGKAARRKR